MEGGSTQSELSRFLIKYPTTPHSITGVAPAQLLMMNKIRTKLDLLQQHWRSSEAETRVSEVHTRLPHQREGPGRR